MGSSDRSFTHGETGPTPGGRNAKGDLQRSFDLTADEYVRSYLERAFPAGVLLSEESGESRFGRGERQYRFVVDPVDGSDNYARRLPLAALNIAMLPAEGPLSPEQILFSIVEIFFETKVQFWPHEERVHIAAARG